MKKEKKVDYKAARAVSKSIRSKFDTIRRELLLDVNVRIDLTVRSLEKELSSKTRVKALAAAKRGLRELRQDLRHDVSTFSRNHRDYHTEDAIQRQFGLMTIDGVVKNR